MALAMASGPIWQSTEGPQNISKRGTQELLPGMILSNEPGYYRTGRFGIRIENLIIVREALEIDGGDRPMMGFENHHHGTAGSTAD